jgi:hypothetical protein
VQRSEGVILEEDPRVSKFDAKKVKRAELKARMKAMKEKDEERAHEQTLERLKVIDDATPDALL